MDSKDLGFFLKQDDDSHWYLIPSQDNEYFDKLLEEMTSSDIEAVCAAEDHFNNYFSDQRIDGPHCIKILTYEEEY